MTTPDPPWKQRTRPCPFYSQGRCLFADSCNFLHDVKIKVQAHEGASHVVRPTPDVFVSSPTKHSPSSFTATVRSPPRSPRLSSLLMALGDAIERDDEDYLSGSSAVSSPAHLGYTEEVVNEKLHDELASAAVTSPVDDESSREEDLSSPDKILRLGSEEGSNSPSSFVATCTDEEGEEEEKTLVVPLPHHSSPVESVVQRLDDTQGDSEPLQERSYDSSVSDSQADTSQAPQAPRTPQRRPRPPSSAPSDFSTLLSPIEITLAPPAINRIGQLEARFSREDSIDSGYADGWTGPSPLALSPPSPSFRRASTLSLLSSPFFGSPSSRVLSSPTFIPPVAAAWPAITHYNSHPETAQVNGDDHTPAEAPVDDELDSPSEYRLRKRSESPRVEPSIEDTVKAQLTPPLPDEGFDEALSFEGGTHSSLVALNKTEPQEEQHSSVRERTPAGGDNTLFDSYYVSTLASRANSVVFSSGTSPTRFSATPRPPSTNSPSLDLAPHVEPNTAGSDSFVVSLPAPTSPRPSVFNRPRKTTPSSLNIPSPRKGLDHPPEPASLPLSVAGPSRLPVASSKPDVEVQTPSSPPSTKIPFGFRHSLRSGPFSRPPSRSSACTPASAPATIPRPSVFVEARSTQSSPCPSQDAKDSSSGVMSPPQSSSSRASRLKPLRLSMIVNSLSASSSSLPSSGLPSSLTADTSAHSASSSALTPSSPTVSSTYSISNNPLLSYPHSTSSPDHDRHSLVIGPSRTHLDDTYQSMPHSAPISRPPSWHKLPDSRRSSRASTMLLTPNSLRPSSRLSDRPSSRLSERLVALDENAEVDFTYHEDENREYQQIELDADDTIRANVVPSSTTFEPARSRPASLVYSPIHAIATPRPTLLFAIASDDVNEVRKVLESGEAGPNDDVGPQSALAFALTANNLNHKMEIVKLLLAHGANPLTLRDSANNSPSSATQSEYGHGRATPSMATVLKNMDPATRYYIARAEAPQTRRASALIYRSFFRPLAKVRYDLVGQDRALEQLFRVLSMPTVAPIVVLLCGPSGHGKSLLARKFGFLLDVPTHTVNMTTLRSTHDIWRSYSMSPYEEPSTSTLADFLTENEGKRCVVVLDEIEKTEDQAYLSSLLMPWELGRCSFEAGRRHVDVSKVIWLGTSNIGHDLVFEHQDSRADPEEPMSRDEYMDLMGMLRPHVSQRLGPSLLSRVTTVLPFAPFTKDEKMAVAAEALYALAGEDARTLPSATVEKLVQNSLREYVPAEGARSLYRAISTQLLDTIY